MLTSASPGPGKTAESRLQGRAKSAPDKPGAAPIEAIFRASDPVDRALREALSPAIATADPYRLTVALIGLAKARSAAGDHNVALGTFRLADQVARTVKSQHLRRLAVMRTAVAGSATRSPREPPLSRSLAKRRDSPARCVPI
jgi:hypothetical protein